MSNDVWTEVRFWAQATADACPASGQPVDLEAEYRRTSAGG